MPKALITGGAGFIGQYVARELSDRGWQVTALDVLHPQVHNDPQGAVDRFPGKVVVGDTTVSADWEQAGPADVIIHLAAETGTAQSMYETERYRHVNVDGTRLAAEHALSWDAPVVFTSSRAVYGEGPYVCPSHGQVTGACCEQAVSRDSREDDALAPVSFYGQTKVEGEALLTRALTGRVPLAVVRPQNVVGPGQALHNPYTGVLAAFLARLREGRPLTVYGDGSATRDFVHVADLAQLLAWLAAGHDDVACPLTVNCGTGVRTNLTQMAQAAAAGSPQGVARIDYLPVHRAGDIEHACADMTRYRAIGAPQQKWTSQEAITDFIRASWNQPGVDSSAWDRALDELAQRGMASQQEQGR